jgi:hypothetical protein
MDALLLALTQRTQSLTERYRTLRVKERFTIIHKLVRKPEDRDKFEAAPSCFGVAQYLIPFLSFLFFGKKHDPGIVQVLRAWLVHFPLISARVVQAVASLHYPDW